MDALAVVVAVGAGLVLALATTRTLLEQLLDRAFRLERSPVSPR